jgi:hypothetical protein
MLPATSPARPAAGVGPSHLAADEAAGADPEALNAPKSAPTPVGVTLLALNIAALCFGPLVLVRPVPAGAEDLARLTGLLVVLAVLGAAFVLTRAGVVSRVLVSALLAGAAATAVHVAAYTVLGTAGRSPAGFWSLGAATVVGTGVALWLGRTALSGPAPVPVVLGGLAVANAVAAAALGAVFLGAGQS